MEYNTAELVAVMSSRVLEDNKTIFAGAGLPLVSSILAQKTRAPHLTIIFEGGAVAPELMSDRLPYSTNEVRTARKAIMIPTQFDIFSLQQRGYVDYGFLGGAQIDMYGNLNTTVIGPYEKPVVRLPGPGGANDIISTCNKIILSLHHMKRSFIPKVDYITSPSYITGGDSRRKSGLIFGSLYKVITHLCIMSPDEKTGRLKLEAVHSGVTPEQVQENTGFELLIPDKVPTTEPPTERELTLLRALDPEKRYITPKKE